MPKVTLWPSGEVLEVNETESLLKQLTDAGKKIKSSCGGHATCGDCVLVVKGGEDNLSLTTFEELRLLGNVFHITKERLSCQTKIKGDVVVDISAHEKKKSSKAAGPVPKSPSVKVRKKEEVQETASKSQEKIEVKKEDDWYRHWDKKDELGKVPPKLGGGKRPRPFKHSEDKDPSGENE